MTEAEKKNATVSGGGVQVESEKCNPIKPDNSLYHAKKELSIPGTVVCFLCVFVLGILVGLMIALYVVESLDRREKQKHNEPIMVEATHTVEAVDWIAAGAGKSETETTGAAANERRKGKMIVTSVDCQLGNDIYCTAECEFCGETAHLKGYDDDFWWNKVLPAARCSCCKKSTERGKTE